MRKNPKLEPDNMNAYIKFSEIMSICSQDIERKQNSGVNSSKKLQKLICINPNLDLVNMNANIKFTEILSICSQDKRNEILASIKGHNSGTNARKMMCNIAICEK